MLRGDGGVCSDHASLLCASQTSTCIWHFQSLYVMQAGSNKTPDAPFQKLVLSLTRLEHVLKVCMCLVS